MNVGGVGIPYSITTNADDPDLAAEFINSLVTEDARNAFIEAGILPSGEIPADAIKEGTLAGDLYGSWNAALEADAIGHYLDWAAPDFYDTLTGELQKLLAGEVDAEEFTSALQEFYAASLES
jgi:raffinose/stachyose/melibiose transport system substrate-binding protein